MVSPMALASSSKLYRSSQAGSSAGVDVGDSTSNEEAVALFAKQKGYKVDTPNVVNDIPESVLPGDDDF